MAELVVDGDDLVLAMRTGEKLWSFHGDVRVPLSSVRRVRVAASPWLVLRGWRSTGVAVPGWIAMGKRRHGGGYDFSLVRNRLQTIVIELNGQEFGELAVSVRDAAADGARISAAAHIAYDPTPDRGPLG